MIYLSLILTALLSFAQQNTTSQNEPAPQANAPQASTPQQQAPPQEAAPQAQQQQPQNNSPQQPQQQPQASGNNSVPPKSSTTMTSITTVTTEAPSFPEAKLSNFDFSLKSLRDIEGKDQRTESLNKFCTLTQLSNCSETFMRPRTEVIDGNMAALFMKDSDTEKFPNTTATIVYSPKQFTRKEAIDFIKVYQKMFPRVHDKISATRVTTASKVKRKSSLILQYDWNVEVSPKNIAKLFVLKQAKTDASYLIFVSANTTQECTNSPLSKFLFSDLDSNNK